MNIPIIDTKYITNADINQLMQIGFAYIKTPNLNFISAIQTCLSTANNIFSNSKEKTKWQVKEVSDANDRYQGYALRSNGKNTNFIEQFFFEPDAPFGPYSLHAELIQDINDTCIQKIFKPILEKIFQRLNLSHNDYLDVTHDPYRTVVFQTYPYTSKDPNVVRFNAHKDFGILTILYFDKPGLEVHYKENWHPILPKPNHLIINVGNALEKMTNNLCHSALHRVMNTDDSRSSMAYFINADYKQKVKNYFGNSIVSESGEIFFKEQFTQYHGVDY